MILALCILSFPVQPGIAAIQRIRRPEQKYAVNMCGYVPIPVEETNRGEIPDQLPSMPKGGLYDLCQQACSACKMGLTTAAAKKFRFQIAAGATRVALVAQPKITRSTHGPSRTFAPFRKGKPVLPRDYSHNRSVSPNQLFDLFGHVWLSALARNRRCADHHRMML